MTTMINRASFTVTVFGDAYGDETFSIDADDVAVFFDTFSPFAVNPVASTADLFNVFGPHAMQHRALDCAIDSLTFRLI
jgi:hypothetical protein